MPRIRMRRVPKGPPPEKPKLPTGLAPGERAPKLDRLRGMIAAEEWHKAFKLAASLPKLGDDKVAIERAWEALARPDFVRGLGRDPDALVVAGKAAMRKRFG